LVLEKAASIGTVERVIRLMQAIAEAKGDVTIKALSQQLELPASTIHRMLSIFLELGIVERGRRASSYAAGVEFYRLGALAVAQTSLREMAQPFMQRVVAGCDEVCVFFRYLKSSSAVMVEDFVESPHPLRYAVDPYRRVSVVWGASGRAVLAFLPEPEIRAALAQGEPSPTQGLPAPSFEDIDEALARIRTNGYAISFGQTITGAVGLAAPVFGPDGLPAGSLCVTIPQVRFQPIMERPVADLLLAESGALSSALGYSPGQSARVGGARG
jgi:DNA-binding IclR family transcriptional regulator